MACGPRDERSRGKIVCRTFSYYYSTEDDALCERAAFVVFRCVVFSLFAFSHRGDVFRKHGFACGTGRRLFIACCCEYTHPAEMSLLGYFFFFHRAYIVFSVLQVFCCSFFPLWYDAHSSTRPSIHTRPPFFFSFSDVLSVGTCCEYTHAPGGDVTLGVFVFSPTVRTYIYCFLRVFCCSFSPPYKCDAHSSAAVRGHTLGLPSVSLLSPSSGCVLFVFAF